MWPSRSFKRAQDLGDGLNRVGRRAAINSGVQIMIGALHDQFAIHDAAQPHADGGQLGREHFGVADDGGVGFDRGPACEDVAFDVFAADFFFAFDQEFHVDRQPAVLFEQPFDGFDQDIGLAFVVGRSARVDVVVADGGLERRRFPFVQRIGRLDVVMAVQQESRFAGRAQPLGVDQRVAFAFDELRLLQAGLIEFAADKLGSLAGYRACARKAC